MTAKTVEESVIELLNLHMGGDAKATSETRILADTTMDSVKVMDFLLELEDELDMTISLNRLAEVETVADLVREIESLQNNN